MKMNNQGNSSALIAFALIVVAVLACNLADETQKANKLVEEGNAAVQEMRKFVAEAEEKRREMINAAEPSIKKDADWRAARTIAKDAIAAYDKAKAKCDEAANKFDEASKLKIKDKFKEYLTLKAKEFRKRAESAEAAKGTPQALIDTNQPAMFISKAKANNEKVDKLVKEADDLASQADKIQKENKDVIKS